MNIIKPAKQFCKENNIIIKRALKTPGEACTVISKKYQNLLFVEGYITIPYFFNIPFLLRCFSNKSSYKVALAGMIWHEAFHILYDKKVINGDLKDSIRLSALQTKEKTDLYNLALIEYKVSKAVINYLVKNKVYPKEIIKEIDRDLVACLSTYEFKIDSFLV